MPAKAAGGAVVVRPGDTLYALARRHGSSVPELQALNPQATQGALRAGDRLRLPAAAGPPPSPSAALELARGLWRAGARRARDPRRPPAAPGGGPVGEEAGRVPTGTDLWAGASSRVEAFGREEVRMLLVAPARGAGPAAQGLKADTFVAFYAPWCGYCAAMEPAWEALAGGLAHDPSVRVAKFRADLPADREWLARELGVRSFPTLLLFPRSRGSSADEPVRYAGRRDTESLFAFLRTSVRRNDAQQLVLRRPAAVLARLRAGSSAAAAWATAGGRGRALGPASLGVAAVLLLPAAAAVARAAARGRGLRPEKPGVDALDLGTVATLDIKLVDTDIAAALRSLFKPPWGSSAGQLAHLLVARAAWTALFAASAALRLLVGAVTLSWLRWGGGGRGSGLNYDL